MGCEWGVGVVRGSGLQEAAPEEEAGFFTIGRRFFRRDGQEEET